MERQPWP